MGSEGLYHSMRYFWDERGRLDGFHDCEKIETEFPEVWQMWQQYNQAKRLLTVVLHAQDYEEDED